MAALVAAAPVIFHANRDQWFFLDEWDFLASRELRSFGSIMHPHNEHWTTVPVVAYRIVWSVVGLHHYWPYLALTVTAHLTATVLLRVVMRRVGVGPWLATAGAVLFMFLGAGRENIGWGFQVTFTGALAFGLAQLLLSDHDGPTDRRDWFGLLCGLGAIMCSGIGVAMVLVVGVAALLRRGWRAAAFHVMPLGVIYLAWYVAYGHSGIHDAGSSPREVARFGFWALVDTVVGLGHYRPAAGLLVMTFLVGLALVAARERFAVLRSASMAVGLLVGAVALMVITGWGRAWIQPVGYQLTPGRYVHPLAALLLPALLLAASAITARWPVALVPLVLLVLVGLPGNVDQLEPQGIQRFMLGSPDPILALAAAAVERHPPRSLQPAPVLAPGLTAGWLIDASKAGRLPAGGAIDPATRATAELMLSLDQRPDRALGSCRTVAKGPIELRSGDVLSVAVGQVSVVGVMPSGPGGPVTYSTMAPVDDPVVNLWAVTTLQVSVVATVPAGATASVCR